MPLNSLASSSATHRSRAIRRSISRHLREASQFSFGSGTGSPNQEMSPSSRPGHYADSRHELAVAQVHPETTHPGEGQGAPPAVPEHPVPVRPQDEPGAQRLSVTLRGGWVEAAMDRRRRGAQALARGSCALGRFTRQDASPGVSQDGSAREFTVLRRRRGAEGQAALTGAAVLLLLRAGRGPGRGGEFQDIPGYECGGESGWTPQQRPAKGGGRRPSSRPPDPQRRQNAPTRRTGRPPLRRSAPTPGSAPPPRSNRGARPASTGAPKCRLDTRILIYREQKNNKKKLLEYFQYPSIQ